MNGACQSLGDFPPVFSSGEPGAGFAAPAPIHQKPFSSRTAPVGAQNDVSATRQSAGAKLPSLVIASAAEVIPATTAGAGEIIARGARFVNALAGRGIDGQGG